MQESHSRTGEAVIEPAERQGLLDYIAGRMCAEARRNEPCIDRQGKGDLIGERHPACLEAEQIFEIARRAE
jgi:hypothetical protein